ncbi:hypothetical protein FHL15_005526 [Xylaria flabelliformis]|uniref:Zn(2)-C6 fungal-type domain-containing protein n=1 Tax=Xylaria flabelliformis TaxID=2512241 RepID=A0A553I026_9PEZI|nr:hypothetical protein FHL15_005526 [Xylaria flabelliformis]
MSETSPRTSNPESKDDERLASCFSCKKSKVKCVRPDGSATCSRCMLRKLECSAPLFHVGRHKGVKNKHSGLEKAVFQIEQALKRTQPGTDQIQDSEQSTELRYLLERSRDLLSAERGQKSSGSGANRRRHEGAILSPQHSSTSHVTSPSQTDSRDGGTVSQTVDDDQLNLDDAENPLQLLARTSELLSSINAPNGRSTVGRLPSKALPSRDRTAGNDQDGNLPVFFGPFQPRLDVGPDLDPIELGLLTLSDFYDNLAHTRWGIDPVLHTVDFVRRRSAFLFTSIAAASALFSPSLEALHKRLSRHRLKLADLVMTKRYKSVEIVLAFMVNIPWISAGEHWADDETSTYMSMALSIAVDLYLNKIILPSSPDAPFSKDNIPSSDQISSRRALNVDGFTDIDPVSEIARGRSYMLPMSQLIENCDQWHLCELADRWDGSIVSVAVLRRDLNKLLTVHVEFSLPPYVDILASHTRLSMYSSIINHSTAPRGARHFFRAAGLSAALNVLRVAVQGEGQLRSMPNNTAIMISFAACFALRVSTVADGRGSSLAPSIRTLIAETIEVLDRIGSTPVQRKGLSCLFAGQLRQILKLASRSAETARVPLAESNGGVSSANPVYTNPNPNPAVAHVATSRVATTQLQIPPGNNMQPDYLLFSTMSNDQLNEAINNTDVGLDALWEDFQFQQASELDWMDWTCAVLPYPPRLPGSATYSNTLILDWMSGPQVNARVASELTVMG